MNDRRNSQFDDEMLNIAAESRTQNLRAITKTAEEAAGLLAHIERLEASLKEAKAELAKLRDGRLVDLMNAAGMSDFKLQDGTKVEVIDYVSGSLPKTGPEHKAAIDLLVKEGHGSIITTEVVTNFGRGDLKLAEKLAKKLEKEGHTVGLHTGVHHSTLQSMARQLIREGKPLAWDKLGLTVGATTKITLPNGGRK
jgi:hypothetical protein